MATKKEAAAALGVSLAEVLRMIKRGDLKAKKKTASVFSDWDIDLKSVKKAGTVEASVKATLAKAVTAPPEAPEPEEDETDAETTQSQGIVKDEEAGTAGEANPKDVEVRAARAGSSATEIDASVESKPLAKADEHKDVPASHPVRDVNPALERRRLFLLKRRQQREAELKKGEQKDGKRTDSGREQRPEGDGRSPGGSNQAAPKKEDEPKWWF